MMGKDKIGPGKYDNAWTDNYISRFAVEKLQWEHMIMLF